MHFSLKFLITSDAFLGKPDPNLLTEQMRMEIFIADILSSKTSNKEVQPSFYDKNGNCQDLCEWQGVTCDESATPLKIDWEEADWILSTTVFECAHLPRTLRLLELTANEIACTLNLASLPDSLVELYVADNAMFGTTNLADLPRAMHNVWFDHNRFEGSLVLQDLPRDFVTLYANHNRYSGEISLADLPPAIERLILYNNRLSGKIMFPVLPKSLDEVNLSKNDFKLVEGAEVPDCVRI